MQISRHLPNDSRLLGIFAPEVRVVWLNDLQQFQHHGGYPTKMSRTRLAIELVAEAFDRDIGDRARGIHLFNTRREEKIHTFLFQQSAIALEIARVLREIFPGSKLKRVHEKRSRDQVTL